MAPPTNAELLAACEEAIRKLLDGGQSAQWGDHQVTMADLPDLEAARVTLKRQINVEERAARGDRSPARHQRASFR